MSYSLHDACLWVVGCCCGGVLRVAFASVLIYVVISDVGITEPWRWRRVGGGMGNLNGSVCGVVAI